MLLIIGSGVASKYYTVVTGSSGALSTLEFTMSSRGSGKKSFALDVSAFNISAAGVASTTAVPAFKTAATGTAASMIEGANVKDTDSAWLTFYC